jgi:hypothetical protein
MLYKQVRTTISGVRVPNNAWPAHLHKRYGNFTVRHCRVILATEFYSGSYLPTYSSGIFYTGYTKPKVSSDFCMSRLISERCNFRLEKKAD